MMVMHTCVTCKEQDYTGPKTLRVTTSKAFADNHARETNHRIYSLATTRLTKENHQ